MTYTLPNRKASRKGKIATRIMDTGQIKRFRAMHPEYLDITLKEFTSIVRAFNTAVIEEVIKNRDGVILPENIGKLSIITFSRSKRKIIDFGKSNETGVLHYHRNWNTDNRLCKIVYNSRVNNLANKNSILFGFIPCREFKKRVSETINKNWQKYLYLDNNIAVTQNTK
jgi:hypothetical protein